MGWRDGVKTHYRGGATEGRRGDKKESWGRGWAVGPDSHRKETKLKIEFLKI